MITAGPGSGKTTVLTMRIVYLIKEKQIPANNCLAITFTKKAAHEMNDRISLLLDTREHSVNIHTFHSLSFSVLKENFAAAGLPEEFHIITEEEKSLYNDSDIPDNMLCFDDLIALTLKLFNNKKEIV